MQRIYYHKTVSPVIVAVPVMAVLLTGVLLAVLLALLLAVLTMGVTVAMVVLAVVSHIDFSMSVNLSSAARGMGRRTRVSIWPK